jgi:hypothetical protein
MNTALLFAVLAESLLIGFRFINKLNIFSIGWMGMGVFALLLLWRRTLRAHHKLHALCAKSPVTGLYDADNAAELLNVTITLYDGFTLAAISVGAVLLGFSKALQGFHAT